MCIRDSPKVVITGFDRKNLYYSVENIRRKDDFVMDYIDRHPTAVSYTHLDVYKRQELVKRNQREKL